MLSALGPWHIIIISCDILCIFVVIMDAVLYARDLFGSKIGFQIYNYNFRQYILITGVTLVFMLKLPLYNFLMGP
jgi:hypothetical protein